MKLLSQINESIKTRLVKTDPVKLVSLGYLIYIFLGAIILSLPISEKVNTSFIDNLFSSASAISTTGLSTININDNYTLFGQIIILLLIQAGGLGYMTFGSFVLLSSKKTLSDHKKSISHIVFSIPKDFIIEKFIRSVVLFTLITEVIGFIPLYIIFHDSGVPNPIWNAIFHSVSSFCTAGFSLFNNSFINYSNNFWLNFTISILSLAGAIGFIVYVDIWRKLIGKQSRLTYTSKIIVYSTLVILFVGTILIIITERFPETTSQAECLLLSFFQSMTALTTVGFNTYPIEKLHYSSLLIIIILMIIGASPAGTGGGLKTTTFSAIYAIIKSTLRRDDKITLFNSEIPLDRLRIAMASFCFYIFVLITALFFLFLTENFPPFQIFFEVASALGTVGLSMGITSNLSVLGKIIITFVMYIGRVGVLTFGMALFVKNELFFDNEKTDLAI